MKGANKRLTKAYKYAEKKEIDSKSKIVIMSDVHRGDGGHKDNLIRNQEIYFGALEHYKNEGFTYAELGDGDELWENRHAFDIITAHKDVFRLMNELHFGGRLWMLCGNHDIEKPTKGFMKNNFPYYINSKTNEETTLFPDMKPYEAIVLEYGKREILLVHGHQASAWNSTFWKQARFLVRCLWGPLESVGRKDPTSASKNYRKQKQVEKKLSEWVDDKGIMMVAGHTHRPMFPKPGQSLYFNDGSCVHPRCITAIEIVDGKISLVKWSIKTRKNRTLYVDKEVLEGPTKIEEFFKKVN